MTDLTDQRSIHVKRAYASDEPTHAHQASSRSYRLFAITRHSSDRFDNSLKNESERLAGSLPLDGKFDSMAPAASPRFDRRSGNRPGKVYRSSSKRIRRISLRRNWSNEMWLFILAMLLALAVVVPWMIGHS